MRKQLMTMLLASALLVPAAAASAAGETMLRSDVMKVQQTLAEAGFYRAGIDGIWGPRTTAALRSYQVANGIPPTGRMDVATVDDMGVTIRSEGRYGYADRYETRVSDRSAEDMNLYLEPAAGTPTTRTMSGPFYATTVFAPMGPSEIQALQQALRDSGYFMKEPVNGIWTPYTVNALRSYQIDKGMLGTGAPDVETLQRLGLQVQAADKLMTTTSTAR